ncbi:hypothetical protein MBEHAL_2687 [Halarchaeum acidiphilum MH1-52-1]|uniref:Uncharacterized protein n=1 Tax=Halarchaeum acidiphilum MH1-52-1 TaxID=1261545 RepID=U2YYP8_9EURY|nr:hypothetical protein [Halarchaeum acidiphilum]GAD53927.1 hypothetical protein MBEHAL_2687 [Halarchaeum acidiphilum MH1-52-1]
MANATRSGLLGDAVANGRLCVAGVALLVLALVVGGLYYARGDIVGTLSILFMVPSAALLIAIGVRGRN